jgi:hypothetical protein
VTATLPELATRPHIVVFPLLAEGARETIARACDFAAL